MLEPQQGMTLDGILDWASVAEESGYGYFFRSDHLLPTIGEGRADSPECWTSLGAVAARTSEVKFGPMVTPIGFRNPAVLARMACTLHAFSGGRLQLGVGAGWFKDEYDANGIAFPGFRTRVAQFREAVSILRPLTEGMRVDFDGAHFRAHTECLPKPKGRVHLIIGGKSRRVIETAAGHADEWNFFTATVPALQQMKAVLDAKSEGRKVEVSQMGSFLIGENGRELQERVKAYMRLFAVPGDADALVQRMLSRGTFCGTVHEFVAQVNAKLEAGVEKFYFQVLMLQEKAMVDLLTETLRTAF